MCPGHGWCGHGGPDIVPTACALARRRCALSGWPEGILGLGALFCCEGRPRSGAHPPPAAHPRGGLSGFAAYVLWPLVCGLGGPALSSSVACLAEKSFVVVSTLCFCFSCCLLLV